MKKQFKKLKDIGISTIFIQTIMLSCLWISCNGQAKNNITGDNTAEASTLHNAPVPKANAGNLVEVKTEHMNFIMPEEIPSGWNTFRYQNNSQLPHFISLVKLPVFEGEQKTFEHFMELSTVFVDAMNLINSGNKEEGFAEFDRLPEWSSEMNYTGGVGLVSGGETAQTTVYLSPGVYVAECYVKTNGQFHPMANQFIVSEKPSNASPPKPTLHMEISKDRGIELKEEPTKGVHTIALHFKDQNVYENFVGHDVHLVKIEKDTDLEALDNWMNWTEVKGLNTPAPAVFLGGAQQMAAGNTAYFTVVLEPGDYAWISEVPSPASKGLFKTFTVPEDISTVGRNDR